MTFNNELWVVPGSGLILPQEDFGLHSPAVRTSKLMNLKVAAS